ncbi:hypothetical protein N7495_002749 [Penicillium taxi]|uniref:uncharacterized protein n=1 Tax=Penicillium taxi TaxID=168475 RepID=UPI00254541E2|nr:uncharacterized protein N7495_002749 [Penicillium taxi]KAJ5902221.1 hypothetical protein N7495_002749 [Penicillium taxi]
MHPEVDVEDYLLGGYNPTPIGDSLCNGCYTIVHKLGFCGYLTIWLAQDRPCWRYVSLKILTSDIAHAGKRFFASLLDQFSINGPNGHHQCLVRNPASVSITKSKDDNTNFMFLLDAIVVVVVIVCDSEA